MVDQMVLATQQWLNSTYQGREGYDPIPENGRTGQTTVFALLHALQIELGITSTADAFGPSTQSLFATRWPQGIHRQPDGDSAESNVYGIIQGALWCKGYSTGASAITRHFYSGTAGAIAKLQNDAGIAADAVVTLPIMKALLSMDQFVLLADYGGKPEIRQIQQHINATYLAYTGLIPTDGVYGRQMNVALIQVLQSLEGYTPDLATGNFGSGTTAHLKKITPDNSSAYLEWVWLGKVALLCNDVNVIVSSQWDETLTNSLLRFQDHYSLPRTGAFDKSTWMSLLTSKGDPNRACIACDTRFEITDSLATKLKADGYSIVGRYLSEPGMDKIKPEEYFKAIRPGELQRILNAGLRFFPIFQENSRSESDFTEEIGKRHGQEAYERAWTLRIPPTVIFFSVDMDIMDYQIDSLIIPYFKGVLSTLQGGYQVGIYAPRHVCQRVMDAGLAVSSFVSDMSSGFSGNLGYPIPDKWSYDQFTEINGYYGEVDLDRVAFGGASQPVDHLLSASVVRKDNYSSLNWIDLIDKLETRYDQLRLEKKDAHFGKVLRTGPEVEHDLPTWHGVLNYLAKEYLRGSMNWSVSAEAFREQDASILEADPESKKIINCLDQWIGRNRRNWKDNSEGEVDIAHFAATALGYLNESSPIRSEWTGWAGDLASALREISDVHEKNILVPIQKIAHALVGKGDNYKEELKGMNLPDDLSNKCNYSDLCSDGDAIAAYWYLQNVSNGEDHTLSRWLRSYYNNSSSLSKRFYNIGRSVQAKDAGDAKEKFVACFRGLSNAVLMSMLGLKEDEFFVVYSQEEVDAACQALSDFIYE